MAVVVVPAREAARRFVVFSAERRVGGKGKGGRRRRKSRSRSRLNARRKSGDDDIDDDDDSYQDNDSGGGYSDSDSDTGGDTDDCVIATHGVSTGGFTRMEKAKAELWCQRTYHGKWYGEAFRRGYKAWGMKHVNGGTAPQVYQEFKDFVSCGRGIKKGFKLKLHYYLRTLHLFITGLFIKR